MGHSFMLDEGILLTKIGHRLFLLGLAMTYYSTPFMGQQ